MRLLLISIALLILAIPSAADSVELAGVRWESSWQTAVQRAQSENKPILHLQILGRLDEKWC